MIVFNKKENIGRRAVAPLGPIMYGVTPDFRSWWKTGVRCKECSKEKGHTIYKISNGKILRCLCCNEEQVLKEESE